MKAQDLKTAIKFYPVYKSDVWQRWQAEPILDIYERLTGFRTQDMDSWSRRAAVQFVMHEFRKTEEYKMFNNDRNLVM